MINKIKWISLSIFILLACFLIPDIYFHVQDNNTMNVITTRDINHIDLSINSGLALAEKMSIIGSSSGYSTVDLNYDYTDKYSYDEVHDRAIDELNTFFYDSMGVPIVVNGIYEMIINKYMCSASDSSLTSFITWNININYFGFGIQLILDYESWKILYMSADFNTEDNTYHSPEDLQELVYYEQDIYPLLDFFTVYTNTDYEDNTTADYKSHYATWMYMLCAYYDYDEVSSSYNLASSSYTTTSNSQIEAVDSDADDITYYDTATVEYYLQDEEDNICTVCADISPSNVVINAPAR
jgi:hypothetical protein